MIEALRADIYALWRQDTEGKNWPVLRVALTLLEKAENIIAGEASGTDD